VSRSPLLSGIAKHLRILDKQPTFYDEIFVLDMRFQNLAISIKQALPTKILFLRTLQR